MELLVPIRQPSRGPLPLVHAWWLHWSRACILELGGYTGSVVPARRASGRADGRTGPRRRRFLEVDRRNRRNDTEISGPSVRPSVHPSVHPSIRPSVRPSDLGAWTFRIWKLGPNCSVNGRTWVGSGLCCSTSTLHQAVQTAVTSPASCRSTTQTHERLLESDGGCLCQRRGCWVPVPVAGRPGCWLELGAD